MTEMTKHIRVRASGGSDVRTDRWGGSSRGALLWMHHLRPFCGRRLQMAVASPWVPRWQNTLHTPRPALPQDETELAAFTPAFLWLLRDFYLRLEEDGRQVWWAACALRN